MNTSRPYPALAPCLLCLLVGIDCGGKTDTETTTAPGGGSSSTAGGATAQGGSRPLTTGQPTGGSRPVTIAQSTGGSGPHTTTKPAGGTRPVTEWQPTGGSYPMTTPPAGGTQPATARQSTGGTQPNTTPLAKGGSTSVSTVAPRTPSVHRAQASSCVGVFAPPEPSNVVMDYNPGCTKHSDCTAGTNGKCVNGIGMAYRMYSCTYDQCATDSDCDAGKICYCTASTSARCLSVGNCQTDADCGNHPYSFCSPSMGWDCGGYRPIDGFHCHTASDNCMDNADCTGTDYCNFDAYEARWKCTPTNTTCVIG